jgi:alpha-tubulin suppressor-like RCC1 family protein
LLALIALSCLTITAQAQFTFVTNNGAITITGYTGTGTVVTVPDATNGWPVTSIAGYAFPGNVSLTNVIIGAGITNIGDYAFSDCTSLAAINVDASNPGYSSVDGVLFDRSQATLIQYPASKVGNYYAIPNSVTSIGDAAFYYSLGLTNIMIPNSVYSIGSASFYDCENLLSIWIPNSVTNIGDWAFWACDSLTTVTVPASVTSVGGFAFLYCVNLNAVYFEGNAPADGGDIFDYDTGVTVYYLPGTIGWGSTFGGAPTMEEKNTVMSFAPGCTAGCSVFIESDGSLWTMGDRSSIGIYSSGNTRPEELIASAVTSATVGGEYFLFTKSDGSAWGMGDNGLGGLGLASLGNSVATQPMEIPLTNVVAIAAGFGHSLFLESDGSLWAVGDDREGQLGDGVTYGSVPDGPTQPEKVVPCGVTKIAAGSDFSLFLKSDGSLWGMGDNGWGQLGDGTFEPGINDACTNVPEEIVASNVTTIAAGGAHSLFLKSDGSLWAMGKNLSGQLGDGAYGPVSRPEMIVSSNVTAIAAGGYFSLFLKSDGSLWAMGDDSYGQLGDGDFAGEWANTNQPEEIAGSNVIAIAAGQYHSLFLKSDGSVWGMGQDDELGDGFVTTQSFIPIQILPTPQPVLAESISGGTNLQFNATCGFGGNFYLLTSTNLAQPVCQWTSVWTNDIIFHSYNVFSATLPATGTPGGQFFILKSD